MRNHVTFVHPARVVTVSEDDGVLSTAGAGWFVELLRRIPDLVIEPELCQEDWGVVVFASRDGSRFWIGLNQWFDADHEWLAHVNHRGFLQRFSAARKEAMTGVIRDFHAVLTAEPRVSSIKWYRGGSLDRAKADPAPTPEE